jgi:uncharacterized protein YdcH (DUF465 family)
MTEEYPQEVFGGEESRQPLYETSPTPVQPTWSVKSLIAETKSGASVPVWKVVNTKMGFSHEKLFRIESIALKVSNILNECVNFNDPRVVRIISDYDKRDRLIKEIRTTEKDAQGKPMKSERLQQLKNELVQIDYRLGI